MRCLQHINRGCHDNELGSNKNGSNIGKITAAIYKSGLYKFNNPPTPECPSLARAAIGERRQGRLHCQAYRLHMQCLNSQNNISHPLY